MTRRSPSWFIGFCAIAASFCGSASHADIGSTFDTGLDGWFGDAPIFQPTAIQHTWGPSGGNTGGYADFLDQDSGTGVLNAPSAFHGNWTAMGINSIQWDSIVFTESFAPAAIPFEVHISGPGGSATFISATNQGVWYSWVTTVAPLNQSLWNLTPGTDWNALLANVTSLRVLDERVSNAGTSMPSDPGDHCGIDNFTLVVPAPGTAAGGLGILLSVARRRRA